MVWSCEPNAAFFVLLLSFFYLARPTLWDVEFANQLSVSINHQARNGLEEMIQWTKEGKLWKYPINNEDGDYYTTQELEFCLIEALTEVAPFQVWRRKLASPSMNTSS